MKKGLVIFMQMEPFSLLTSSDIDNIDAYIKDFANESHWHSREHNMRVILRHWNEEKSEYLLPLFDNQLIIKRTLNYEAPIDEVAHEIENLPIYKEVAGEFYDLCADYYVRYNDYYSHTHFKGEYSHPECPSFCTNVYEVRRLITSWCLAQNKYDDCSVKIEDISRGEGHFINIQTGCKPLRILQKINNAYHFTEKLEELRIAISVIFNKRKISGEVYLSIHPMDYMTMSDNACHWSSCMSWEEQGCYRQGTVEMMNSPMVIVAYLTSSEDYRFYDRTWNSKRWRSLYIVDRDMITSIKAYPYDNKSLDYLIVEELKKMCHEKFGWNYGQIITHDGNIFVEDDREYDLRLNTNEMYNDFGSCTHTACVNSDLPEKVNCISLNYSGLSECMWCGISGYEYDGHENSLVCCNCGDVKYCADCGERIYNDEYYYDGNGNYICSQCRWDNYDYDITSGELYHVNDLTEVYVIPKEFRDKVDPAEIIIRNPHYCEIPMFRIYSKSDWQYVSKVEFHEVKDPNYWGGFTNYFIYDDEFESSSRYHAFESNWYDYGQHDYKACRQDLIDNYLEEKEEIA